jgi:Flp pilus assembly protein TadG
MLRAVDIRRRVRRSRHPSRLDDPRHWPASRNRRGAAVVELAVLVPLLAFLFVIAIDFGRIYHYSLTLQNCARAGALYASDPYVAHESPFASTEEAALADATNISPAPTITTTSGTDAFGRPYVEVSAAYHFSTFTQFPGVPNETITRSVRMYRAAITPDVN